MSKLLMVLSLFIYSIPTNPKSIVLNCHHEFVCYDISCVVYLIPSSQKHRNKRNDHFILGTFSRFVGQNVFWWRPSYASFFKWTPYSKYVTYPSHYIGMIKVGCNTIEKPHSTLVTCLGFIKSMSAQMTRMIISGGSIYRTS